MTIKKNLGYESSDIYKKSIKKKAKKGSEKSKNIIDGIVKKTIIKKK